MPGRPPWPGRSTGSPVALRVVAEDVVDRLYHLIDDLPVVVEIDVPPTAHLPVNQRVLSIVLGNLVRNELQRTERGHVRIAATEAGLEVSNTGRGIPAEILDRVTGRGVRGSSGGHGLGLAIVRTLCERCGWRLGIESAEDQRNDLPLFPLPSVLDFSRGSGWGVALGAAVEYESAYDGSDEMEFEVEPAGAVHWRRGNHLILSANATYEHCSGDIEDSPIARQGCEYEVGPSLVYHF